MDTARIWRFGIVAGVVFLGIAVAVVWPSWVVGIEKERMVRRVSAWEGLRLAMDSGAGYPADLGVHSTQEYLELLIKEGYLNISDLALYGDLVLANISEKDPPGTVVLISRSYYNYLYHDTKFPREYIVIRRPGGVDQMRMPISKEELRLPPREPSILPPRRLALD